MKKILFIFALFLSMTMSAQEKVTFEDALKHVGVSDAQTTEVMAIANEKKAATKEIKNSGLDKAAQKVKKKELNKATNKKIEAIVGKEKYKAAKAYMKANKTGKKTNKKKKKKKKE